LFQNYSKNVALDVKTLFSFESNLTLFSKKKYIYSFLEENIWPLCNLSCILIRFMFKKKKQNLTYLLIFFSFCSLILFALPHVVKLPMTSLPIILASSPLRNLTKPCSTSQIPKPIQNSTKQPPIHLLTKTNLSVTISQLIITSPVLASESFDSISSDPSSGKIDLESILVTIDNFFNKYPFFVAGCTFTYLVVYPAVMFYLRKYKPISAMNAFRKLKNESDSQLLDIRDVKTLALLASPNLKFLGKSSVQVPFSENDEEGFLTKVKGSFSDAENTVVCVLDK